MGALYVFIFSLTLILVSSSVEGTRITFQGVSNELDPTCATNLINGADQNTQTFLAQVATLQPGDIFFVPNQTYCMQGNLSFGNLNDITFLIDGTLLFQQNVSAWPVHSDGKTVFPCWYMWNLNNVRFTSSSHLGGALNGNGAVWWGYISYLLNSENRPRLFHIYNATKLLIENLYFTQSPYWTVTLDDVAQVEVRYSKIENRVTSVDYHDLENLGAFNTDGFDIAGRDIWVHHCWVWNQDDCFCVKPLDGNSINSKCSENYLWEDNFASGVGLTIGSISASNAHSCIRNITFRNTLMHNTFKGLYLKSNPSHPGTTGEVSHILYDNITIFNASQWALWLGPQQAAYSGDCSLLWPFLPGTTCPVPSEITWNNITFRNILIDSPQISPGVITGNNTNPMRLIKFENVTVLKPGMDPWGGNYWYCDGLVNSTASGGALNPTCLLPVWEKHTKN